MEKLLVFLFFVLTFGSCLVEPEITNPGGDREVTGMRPVYDTIIHPTLDSPRASLNLGKLLVYEDYLFVIEKLKGVHVIDNSIPNAPKALGFIKIDGAREITADGDVLFVNYGANLMMIDISNILFPVFVDFIYGFYEFEARFPADYNGSFECADEEKGNVILWESATLFDPQCWR